MNDRCQIIQFGADMNLASNSMVLRPMEPSPAAWRGLFAVALDELATLVAPKTIVYCEGRDTPGIGGLERGMDAKVLNAIFNSTKPETLFISSGGNTELDQRSAVAIAILGKVFPNIEIHVFKDRDMASGKQADENDRQIYLKTNPNNHRVMKRFEIENYLYDKEVLEAYCSENHLSLDGDAYDTAIDDVVNQNLKDMTGKIKSICGIRGSVNPESFKVALAHCVTPEMAVDKELYACIFDRE